MRYILLSFLLITSVTTYAAQCRAITQKGTRCKRTATVNQFCWQHTDRLGEKASKNLVEDAVPHIREWNTRFGLPGGNVEVIEHYGLTIGYSTKHKQPLWVSYYLSYEKVKTKVANRKAMKFCPDPKISTSFSAQLSDYKYSGFHRGHMAPAADMSWSPEALRESFYLSNICPQTPKSNTGTWANLEKFIREWVPLSENVYIVTGPIFTSSIESIGSNSITIPTHFYKVAYTPNKGGVAIAFILPNDSTKSSIFSFSTTIDNVESITGLDFFSSLPDDLEHAIESTIYTPTPVVSD